MDACEGHAGVEGDVIADRLAGKARKEASGLSGRARDGGLHGPSSRASIPTRRETS